MLFFVLIFLFFFFCSVLVRMSIRTLMAPRQSHQSSFHSLLLSVYIIISSARAFKFQPVMQLGSFDHGITSTGVKISKRPLIRLTTELPCPPDTSSCRITL